MNPTDPLSLAILAAVVVFSVIVFWLPLWRTRRLRGTLLPKLGNSVESALPTSGGALIYFYSTHCSHCRRVGQVVDGLANDGVSVLKENIAQSPDLARRLGVRMVPTVLVVEDRRVTQVLTGESAAKKLRDSIGKRS